MIIGQRLSPERGGVVRSLLFLGLVVAACFAWQKRLVPRALQAKAGHLESAVNRGLAAEGLEDSDLISQLRREQSKAGLAWIEVQRTFRVNSAEEKGAVLRRLRSIASKEWVQLAVVKPSPDLTVELRWAFLKFQTLTFQEAPRKAIPIAAPAKVRAPAIALVIDDVAYDERPMDRFASLGVPLTFAILPRDRHSRRLSEKATKLRFPVILHLPMEPLDLEHNNPGGAALYLNMTDEELHKQFEKDVASVPHIVGINNHMGSAFTSERSKMDLVMRWVKEKGFFFLDSRTSPKSTVVGAARAAGVPCVVNETFLDNEDSVEAIEQQLDKAMALAIRDRHTIAIGHYRRKWLVEALSKKIPELKAKGISMVELPSLVPISPRPHL